MDLTDDIDENSVLLVYLTLDNHLFMEHKSPDGNRQKIIACICTRFFFTKNYFRIFRFHSLIRKSGFHIR
jgi:hypothetical protein